MSNTTTAAKQSDAEADAAWGAKAIGEEIDRSRAQVYYLYRVGALAGAVTKLGPKTYVGSRRKLRALHLGKTIK